MSILGRIFSRSNALVSIALTIVLAACGGSTDLITGIAPATKTATFGQAASAEIVEATSQQLASYFNGQYANNPKALMGVQPSLSTNLSTYANDVPKIAATNIPKDVYRFYNTNTGAHFFTMSTQERDYVKNTFPFYAFEGTAFFAYPEADPTLSPVYRFYNNKTGTHFFTINPAEKEHVIATWPTLYSFEGASWYASTASETNLIPVYRFFNTRTGAHFYTTSVAEKDHVIATWNWFNFEGIAYYAQQAKPEACRADTIGNTGYSLVFKGCNADNVAEYYDKTECVRDNATGLIWQGLTGYGTGLRDATQRITNYDNTTEVQKWKYNYGPMSGTVSAIQAENFTTPTQADIDRVTNKIGFQNAINASQLCGSNAWRMPTPSELLGLRQASTQYAQIDNEWFPNTADLPYWTSAPSSENSYSAMAVDFGHNKSYRPVLFSMFRDDHHAIHGDTYIRLVR